MVMAGRLRDAIAWVQLDELIRDTLDARSWRTTASSLTIARDAFLRFGKGRHPARLNCGDCASYALAKSLNIPLLFKGADFAKTDIVPALAAPA